ncbi:hypothetical protein BC629DRAFT_1590775 [Irpex lacteus]|nr:hypothetical protein BC629DRAFT_1590775 [Irpex lacteus]
MSSVGELQLQLDGSYIELSLNVLYFFESIITFSQEVEVVWCRKWTATTWLYAFTRYTSLLFSIWIFIPTTQKKYVFDGCQSDQYIIDAFELIQYVCFASFSALRVYALLNGKIIIAVVVFLLNLVPLVTNLRRGVGHRTLHIISDFVSQSPVNTCVISLAYRITVVTDPRLRTQIVSLVTRVSVIVGDVLLIAVTWFKTARLYKDARKLNVKAPLATLLFRDGTFYFIILLILNILQIIEQNNTVLYSLTLSTSLQIVMTPVIICRFILDLRQVETYDSRATISGNLSMRFVGNLGQSLQTGMEFEDEEEISSLSYETEDSSVPAEIFQESGGESSNDDVLVGP